MKNYIFIFIILVSILDGFSQTIEGYSSFGYINISDDTLSPEIILDSKYPFSINNNQHTIEGIVSDNKEVKELRINNEIISFSTEGKFSYTIDLQRGENEFSISAKDVADNRIEHCFVVNCSSKKDIEKPKIILSADYPFTTNKLQHTISGEVSDNKEVKELRINNEIISFSAEGKFSYTIDLQPGENEFGIFSEDNTGNQAMQRIVINYDNHKPTISLIKKFPQKTISLKHQIKGEVSDNQEIKELKIGNENIGYEYVSVQDNGAFLHEITINQIITDLVIIAIDKAGNRAQEELFILYKDTIPPQVELNVEKEIEVTQPEFTIEGKMSDNIGIEQVVINSMIIEPHSGDQFSHKVELKKGKNDFDILISDGEGNFDPKTISIIFEPNRTDYALLIAVDQSETRPDRLPNVVSDTKKLNEKLTELYGFETDSLINPTTSEVEQRLIYYKNKIYNENDQLLVFFSGHGDVNIFADDTTDSYFVFYDDKISHSDFVSTLNNSNCNHILLMANACFSGRIDRGQYQDGNIKGLIDEDNYRELNIEEVVEEQLRNKTRKLLASGANETPSGYEGFSSPFMKKVIEALTYQKYGRIVEFYELRSHIKSIAYDNDDRPVSGYFHYSDEAQSNFLFIKK